MYHIQGADKQTRGPVDENTIRQWINEGRANGTSLAVKQGDAEWRQLSFFPEFATALSQAPPPAPAQGDATGGLIPYKNVPALVGYYMSILGLLLMCVPILGVLYGIGVMTLGIFGIKKANAQPEVKGKVHAWIAIVGGLFELGVGIFMSIGFLSNL